MPNDLIAYCGLYCGACSFKVAFEENNREHLTCMPSKYDYLKGTPLEACPGCRLENRCGECVIRDCTIEKSLEHCGLCESFPCEKIKKFNNDGVPHHAESIKNLIQLAEIGKEKWLTQQREQNTCSCGKRYSWYVRECPNCDPRS